MASVLSQSFTWSEDGAAAAPYEMWGAGSAPSPQAPATGVPTPGAPPGLRPAAYPDGPPHVDTFGRALSAPSPLPASESGITSEFTHRGAYSGSAWPPRVNASPAAAAAAAAAFVMDETLAQQHRSGGISPMYSSAAPSPRGVHPSMHMVPPPAPGMDMGARRAVSMGPGGTVILSNGSVMSPAQRAYARERAERTAAETRAASVAAAAAAAQHHQLIHGRSTPYFAHSGHPASASTTPTHAASHGGVPTGRTYYVPNNGMMPSPGMRATAGGAPLSMGAAPPSYVYTDAPTAAPVRYALSGPASMVGAARHVVANAPRGTSAAFYASSLPPSGARNVATSAMTHSTHAAMYMRPAQPAAHAHYGGGDRTPSYAPAPHSHGMPTPAPDVYTDAGYGMDAGSRAMYREAPSMDYRVRGAAPPGSYLPDGVYTTHPAHDPYHSAQQHMLPSDLTGEAAAFYPLSGGDSGSGTPVSRLAHNSEAAQHQHHAAAALEAYHMHNYMMHQASEAQRLRNGVPPPHHPSYASMERSTSAPPPAHATVHDARLSAAHDAGVGDLPLIPSFTHPLWVTPPELSGVAAEALKQAAQGGSIATSAPLSASLAEMMQQSLMHDPVMEGLTQTLGFMQLMTQANVMAAGAIASSAMVPEPIVTTVATTTAGGSAEQHADAASSNSSTDAAADGPHAGSVTGACDASTLMVVSPKSHSSSPYAGSAAGPATFDAVPVYLTPSGQEVSFLGSAMNAGSGR